MKEHLKKYGTRYQIILSIIFLILTVIFIYLGYQNKKVGYTEEEATGIMKLKAGQLTRMIEIGSDENSCKNNKNHTLSTEEMNTYGFEKKLYKSISYTMKCEDNKQIISVSIIGDGDFKGYQINNYIDNE